MTLSEALKMCVSACFLNKTSSDVESGVRLRKLLEKQGLGLAQKIEEALLSPLLHVNHKITSCTVTAA